MPNYFMHTIDQEWINFGTGPQCGKVGGIHSASQCIICLGVRIRVPKGGRSVPGTMGKNGLFFILAFVGWQKIGRASALSGFLCKICQTTPATQAILDDHAPPPHGRHGQEQPPFCAGVLVPVKFLQRFRAV